MSSARAGTLEAGYKRACVYPWSPDIQKGLEIQQEAIGEILDFLAGT
ncbi:hypothetical protein [Candidatus Enterovibrio escicola]|nr:hypothetical protein [Candidatus Enterovibrio escacola]